MLRRDAGRASSGAHWRRQRPTAAIALAQENLIRIGVWRRGPGSNRRIKVLQTSPLPLGYRALAGLADRI